MQHNDHSNHEISAAPRLVLVRLPGPLRCQLWVAIWVRTSISPTLPWNPRKLCGVWQKGMLEFIALSELGQGTVI